MYAVLITVGMLVRSRRQLIASLEERARAAETEQRLRVEEARLLERERIAREMHDVLAHRISLLAVHAGALEFRPDASPPPSGAGLVGLAERVALLGGTPEHGRTGDGRFRLRARLPLMTAHVHGDRRER